MAAPPLPFWCHICEVGCHSAINLQTHFLGVKHRKLEGALKEHALGHGPPEGSKPRSTTPEDDPTAPANLSRPPRNLEEQLDRCRSTEPALGLEYVEEHRCPGRALKYVCTLCDCEEPTNNMFMHVVGSKHRLAYLSKHYPERARVPGKGSRLNKNLRAFAAEVEARDGRKQIRVVIESRPPKRKIDEEEDEEANESQGAPHIGPYVDSSPEDTTVDTLDTPAPAAQGPSALFLELKKAHEELVKKRDQERTATTIGTFASNKELLDYLDKFEVASEDDVDFVLTVNERFTSALAEYETRCETNTVATTKHLEIHRTEEITTHQGVCTVDQPQNVSGKHVTITNALQMHPSAAAGSKPVFYNPSPAWINKIPAPKEISRVICSNPAIYSAAASIAPANKVENVSAYYNPTPFPAFPPPNLLPKPLYYASAPETLPTSQASPKVISAKPVHYSSAPSAVPPPKLSPVIISAKPVYYKSTPASVPPPKPSPVVISAKPIYYNLAKASTPECKLVDEKVVKDTTTSAVVPVKKIKKRKIN